MKNYRGQYIKAKPTNDIMTLSEGKLVMLIVLVALASHAIAVRSDLLTNTF